MKRSIVFIIAIIMMLQISVPVFAEGSNQQTTYKLITHWDFEGKNAAERLTDKATDGNSSDTLTRNGTVLFSSMNSDDSTAPWIVTVDEVKDEYISAEVADESSDLYSMANKTIIFKARVNSDGRTAVSGILGKQDCFAYGIHNSEKNNAIGYVYYKYLKNDVPTVNNVSVNSTEALPTGEFRVFVMSFDYAKSQDGETLAVKQYVSNKANVTSVSDLTLYNSFNIADAADAIVSQVPKPFDSLDGCIANLNSFILGKRPDQLSTNRKLTVDFDYVKIYDSVLTDSQIVTESFETKPQAPSSPDAAPAISTCAYTVGDEFVSYFQSDDTNYVTVAGNSWTNVAAEGAMGEKALKCVTKGTSISDNGAYLTFPVPKDDEYYIWARMYYETASNNSLFYQIDEGGESYWDLCDEEEGADCYSSWQYVLLTERKSGSYTDDTVYSAWTIENGEWRHSPMTLTLTAGEHTLKLTGREDGMFIDEFVVTSYAPNEYDPNAYDGNTSVLSSCKYCTSDVIHYYSDGYTQEGIAAQSYFASTLHTDAVTYTLPKVKLPTINVAQTVPPVKFEPSNKAESDTQDAGEQTETNTAEKSGCGSVVGASLTLVLCCAALATVKRKKKSH